MSVLRAVFGSFVVVAFVGCGVSTSTSSFDSTDETGQQVGDAMASIDEVGGSSGSFATYHLPLQKLERIYPASDVIWDWLVPTAYAASCTRASTFGSCSSNVITRTFDNCSIGRARFDGTITITFDDAAVDSTCRMTAENHSVSRAPDFTITGRAGGTFSVEKTGTFGQKITKGGTSGSFTFENDGIRRTFTNAAGEVVGQFKTETVTAIGITGESRANRVLDGGGLRITNELTNVTCTITPTAVTYESGCNCATSGSWTGTCSDGDSLSVTITGCGTSRTEKGDDEKSVTFDRCSSL